MTRPHGHKLRIILKSRISHVILFYERNAYQTQMQLVKLWLIMETTLKVIKRPVVHLNQNV